VSLLSTSKKLKLLSTEAIHFAINELSENGDIILVTGKGHETYQDIQGVKHDFDDRVIIREAFGI
jgi:UDP-N-acetylmuramoyl-L-alanyl-D-glutamate--2,6-diaminopimelate ligase